jgi:lambda repressor-like predicted transcriptional regulator
MRGWLARQGGNSMTQAADRPIPGQDAGRQVTGLYASGLSLRQVADRTGLSRTTVRRVLDRHGVTRRPPGRARPPASPPDQDIISLYLSGLTITDTAARAGLGRNTVARVLDRHRVPRRPEGRPRPPGSPPDQELISLYAAGHSLRQVAAKTGLDATTIRRVLARAGVPRRPPGATRPPGTPPDQDITGLYVSGLSLRQAAAAAGVTPGVVQRALIRAGIARRPPAGRARSEQITRLYAAGHSLRQIAAATGLSSNTVRRALARAGITRRPPGHPRPPGTPTDQDIISLYTAGLTLSQIQARTGLHAATARLALIRHGIPRRPPGPPAASQPPARPAAGPEGG